MKKITILFFALMSIIVAAVSFSHAQDAETPKKISLLEAFRGMVSKIKQSTNKTQPVKFVAVSESYDARQHSVITGARLNMFLKGVLRDKGDLFINVARDNDICPIVLAAIAMHESANGNSKFSRERNNVFGIYLRGKYHYFNSVDECVKYAGKLLGGKMYCGGRNYTVKKIQQIYCPVGAGNDPRGINKYWLSGVLDKMKTLWGREICVLINA
jgi:hypothetical protein